MGGFWPRTYVVKTGHARDSRGHIFLVADAQFLVLQRPLFSLLSLRAAIYSPVPFIGCIGSSHIKFRSGRSADLRSLRWCSIGRLDGVGYMRIVIRVTQGKIFRFCTT
jgi:hypothetical protein